MFDYNKLEQLKKFLHQNNNFIDKNIKLHLYLDPNKKIINLNFRNTVNDNSLNISFIDNFINEFPKLKSNKYRIIQVADKLIDEFRFIDNNNIDELNIDEVLKYELSTKITINNKTWFLLTRYPQTIDYFIHKTKNNYNHNIYEANELVLIRLFNNTDIEYGNIFSVYTVLSYNPDNLGSTILIHFKTI